MSQHEGTSGVVVENVARVGKYAWEHLNAEFTSLPCVAEASGLGLMIGIEIVADKVTKKPFDSTVNVMSRIHDEALKRGFMFVRFPSQPDRAIVVFLSTTSNH